MPSEKPNPGSPDAVKQGCTCPRIDNHHGDGRNGKFIRDLACPLHGEDIKHAE